MKNVRTPMSKKNKVVELKESEKITNFETMTHINQVRLFMTKLIVELMNRLNEHDNSKMASPELEFFNEFTPILKNLVYGSDEYKESLKKMKPALDHHYANNRHHPEYFDNGINGMNLIDLIEMLCDFKAATMRNKDGDIRKSLEINKKRFNISDQLFTILNNTVDFIEK